MKDATLSGAVIRDSIFTENFDAVMGVARRTILGRFQEKWRDKGVEGRQCSRGFDLAPGLADPH